MPNHLLSPRWIKLWRDALQERERTGLMLAALLVSLLAVGSVLGGYLILHREIRTSYLSTRPAQATLEMERGIDGALLERVRKTKGVAAAEAHDVLQARVKVGQEWLPLLVFASDTIASLQLNRYAPEQGKWPIRTGAIVLERSALPVLKVGVGDSLKIKFPHAGLRSVPLAGTVHDPGLSPANQERSGYAYLTTATLASLGEESALHELRVSFAGSDLTTPRIQEQARALAQSLQADGFPVHEVRVPPFQMHPHQAQMETVMLMMLAFAALALVLSAVLVATTLSAWLSRQTRELAILKTVGASTAQLSRIYLTIVAILGIVAVLMAWPLSILGARTFAGLIARMLNFDLSSLSIPCLMPFVLTLAGIGVPLVVAAVPILRASRRPVREALGDHGAAGEGVRQFWAKWPEVVRQTVRRPVRLALSLALLATSGAIFLSALNVREGWKANLDKIWQTRHYDIEVRFRVPLTDSVISALKVPGVQKIEPWGWSPGALARPGEIEVTHAWPDKGHGSFSFLAPPVGTKLVSFPLLQGRRLTAQDSNATVLNHIAWAQAGKPALGGKIGLGVDGQFLSARLVGVIEEVGSPGMAYLTRTALDPLQGDRHGVRMVRIVTTARNSEERTAILHALEQAMERQNLPVQMAVPFSELRTAIGDHVKILVGALAALAGIVGLVGMLGLVSVTGMGVLERTREFGVLRTLGATPRRISRKVVAETLFTGSASGVLGVLLALPLTLGLDRLIGSLGFLAPLPFVFGTYEAIGWLLAVCVISMLAGWVPARRAGRTPVKEALLQV